LVLYYFIYALLGRLIIYLIQSFPLIGYLSSLGKPLEKLFGCDLCLGVWVYWFLAWILNINIFNLWFPSINTVFAYFLTGAVTSFIMYLIALGWKDQFSILEIK
jgi:hypothetical protein